MLRSFRAIAVDRKMMKAAKSYRLYFEIVDNLEAATDLTGKIEDNIQIRIQHNTLPQVQAVLNPCHVVDVTHKNKKFIFVCETCSEYQNAVGQLITPVLGDQFTITYTETDESIEPAAPKAQRTGSITEQSLKGLHSMFFQNKKFWDYISSGTGRLIGTTTECKTAFKEYLGVTSCKELQQEDVDGVIRGFNAWLNRGASA